MYTVSDLFKDYIVQHDREFDIKADIAGVMYLSDSVIEFTVEDTIVPGEELSIGSVITSKLSLSLKTADAIPKNAKIKPYVRLNGAAGFTEWVQLSEFYIDERSFQNNTWKFTCFDRLLVSNQSYVSSAIFPASMQTVWNEIMTQLGLISDASVVIDPTYMIPFEPLDYPMHDMMSFIASAHGASAGIAKDGKVKFIKLTGGPVTTISAANYITANKTNDLKTIKKIVARYNEDGETYVAGAGTDAETLRVFNPFITQTMVDTIFAALNGFTYTPFTMNWVGRPDIEVGDKILVTLRDTSTIPSTILMNKMSFKGGLLAVSTAPSVSENRSETDYKVNLKDYIDNSGLKEDKPYYGVSIGRKNGIKITRSDGASMAILNSDFLKFIGKNHSIMINEWGFNPDFIKRFPNKIVNSGFEWYDETTLVPMYWTGTGAVDLGSNWDGTVSLELSPGEYEEQGMLNENTPAGADPAWWNDLQTRVSLKYKGGKLRVKVLKVSDSSAYQINDNSAEDGAIRTGAFLDYPAALNWENGYISFYFTPIAGAGSVKIRLENVDTGMPVNIDAVQIEPDFTGLWPSIYSAGPRSIPMADILGAPGSGGIYHGLEADMPSLNNNIVKTLSFSASGLGYRESDSSLWSIDTGDLNIYKHNTSGALLDSWSVGSGGNGCEIDDDNDDFIWITHSGSYVRKYQISTKTQISSWIINGANGVCAPPGNYIWVGLNSPDRVVKVNKNDGTVIETYNMPHVTSDLAWDGQNVWVSYTDNSIIEAYDPANGFTFVRSFTGPYSNHPGLTFDGKHLWAAYASGGVVSQLSEGKGTLPILYYATDTKIVYWNVDGVWTPVIGGVTDHGLLDGLADDDHPQYLNAARHNALAHTFLALTDSPNTFVGQAGKVLAINAGETGIEFIVSGTNEPPSSDATSIQGKYVPIPAAGDDEKVLAYDSNINQMKWVPQGVGADASFITGTPVDATANKTDGYVLTYDAATGKILLKPKPAGGGDGGGIGTLNRYWTRQIGVQVSMTISTSLIHT